MITPSRPFGRLPRPGFRGALDDEHTAAGTPNYHHLAYVTIANRYGVDAVRMMREQPLLYVRGLCAATSLFFRPASDYEYFGGFRRRVPAWHWIYHVFLYGQLTAPDRVETRAEARDLRSLVRRIGWFILVGTPLLMLYGFVRLRAARRAHDRSFAGTMAFILITVSYLIAVAVGLNVGENQRYRFLIEPFLFVLIALWSSAACRRLGSRWG